MTNSNSKKKSKYILLLLISVVVLGLGYAAVANITLNITGSATANGNASDSDFVVRFVKSSDSTNEIAEVSAAAANPASYNVITGDDVNATASITNDTTAAFSVDNMVANDEVTFTYYIVNLSNEIGANITPAVTNDYSDNFTVTVNPSSAFSLDDGEVQVVTVTVKCVAQDLQDKTGSFTVSFTAAATE